MDQERLKDLLLEFREGRLDLDQAMERMRHLPYEDLGYAQVDHHRSIRLGFPEVIFGLGKTPEQIVGVASSLDSVVSRIIHTWARSIGLDPATYGTHSMRRTKPTLIYRRTKNLRAVQLLLGHTKLESTVRYLGIEVDDALEIAEQTEV